MDRRRLPPDRSQAGDPTRTLGNLRILVWEPVLGLHSPFGLHILKSGPRIGCGEPSRMLAANQDRMCAMCNLVCVCAGACVWIDCTQAVFRQEFYAALLFHRDVPGRLQAPWVSPLTAAADFQASIPNGWEQRSCSRPGQHKLPAQTVHS